MSNIILMSLIGLGLITSFSFVYSVKKEFYIIEPGEIKEIKGSENMASKKFDIQEFNTVNVHHQISVIYSVGEYNIEAKAEDNLLEFISIRKHGNEVDVFIDNRNNDIRNTRPYTVFIQTPQIEHLSLEDQSEFQINGKLIQENLSIELEQQASFTGSVELQNLMIKSEDQARITISGSTENLEIDLENQSTYFGDELQSQHIKARLSEQSTAKVYSNGEVIGSISGRSSLDISGSPDTNGLLVRDQAKLN